NENLLLSLRQSVDGYIRTQQELGEFVLRHAAKVVYLTLIELARESGTSEGSVTRLCRTLGCKGYADFKMVFALDLLQVQSVE
ncbi:MurR/RpiR family transcriptional regulator, partial [Escherichia coli]|uniref:MurR/RpiR family transcriptional regulator n=1 Tax=Escherichia coli TaxID=562 RepID=UPI0012B83252